MMLSYFQPACLRMLCSVQAGMSLSGCLLDRHQARLAQMLELMVRTLNPRQKPAFRFQLLDDLPAIHGGYNNHRTSEVNPSNTTPFSLKVISPAVVIAKQVLLI